MRKSDEKGSEVEGKFLCISLHCIAEQHNIAKVSDLPALFGITLQYYLIYLSFSCGDIEWAHTGTFGSQMGRAFWHAEEWREGE